MAYDEHDNEIWVCPPGDIDEDKAIGQFRLQLGGLLFPLRKYGQAVYVDGVMPEIINLAIQLHLRLSGEENPICAREDIHEVP